MKYNYFPGCLYMGGCQILETGYGEVWKCINFPFPTQVTPSCCCHASKFHCRIVNCKASRFQAYPAPA